MQLLSLAADAIESSAPEKCRGGRASGWAADEIESRDAGNILEEQEMEEGVGLPARR